MKGHLESNSHIWDNCLGNFAVKIARKNAQKHCHDSTGSTVEIFRVETEVTTKTITSSSYEKQISMKHSHTQKPKKSNPCDRSFVTESDRDRAVPPNSLGVWKYDPRSAFDEYSKRITGNGEGVKSHAKRVKIDQEKLCHVEKPHPRTCWKNNSTKICKKPVRSENPEVGSTLEISNLRNDEIKIEQAKIRKENPNCPSTDTQLYEPAFYGTIEAEKCADRVAEHLSLACENLSRLHFITERNYPQASKQLKTLSNIGNEVREFNAQLRVNRAKVPKNILLNGSNVAHFIVENNSMR